MSPMFLLVRTGRHSRRKLAPHVHWRGSMRRRKSSGASSRQSHLRICCGASGFAHGSAWHAEIWPPLANEVSRPGPSRRSIAVTSWPCAARYHAVAVPTTPAPRTRAFMAGGVWRIGLDLSTRNSLSLRASLLLRDRETAPLRRPPGLRPRRLHARLAGRARASGAALLRAGARGGVAAALLRRPAAPLAPRLRGEPRIRDAPREAGHGRGAQRRDGGGDARARARGRDPRLARRAGERLAPLCRAGAPARRARRLASFRDHGLRSARERVHARGRPRARVDRA